MPNQYEEERHIENINRAAATAADVLASAAANAKEVIHQAAATAIATLTTAAAVQSRDIEYIKEGMRSINAKLDNLDNRYVANNVFVMVSKRVDDLESAQKVCRDGMISSDEFVLWRNIIISVLAFVLVTLVGVIITLLLRKI